MGEDSGRKIIYDKVRGLAIILVVLGHAIQASYTDFFHVNAFNIIYSFHIPLFMFISGLVTYKKDRKINLSWLKLRFLGLAIPFWTWVFIPFMFNHGWRGGVITYVKEVLISPDKAHWFLWVLFLLCIVNYCCTIVANFFKIEHGEIVVFIVILLLSKSRIPFLGIPLLVHHAKFYFIGYYLSKYKAFVKRPAIILGILCGVVWLFTVQYWRFLGDYPFRDLLDQCIRNVFENSSWQYTFLYNNCITTYNTIISFGGIFITASIAYFMDYLVKNEAINNGIIFLGKHTLEIYVLHSFFLGTYGVSIPIFKVIFNFVCCFLFSLIIIFCFQKNKVSQLMFGKKIV